MKIAQVAPLAESVPPALYGGTERVVSYLTEELVALGYDVTLFASGNSITDAELVPVCPRALQLSPEPYDAAAAQAFQMELLLPRAHEFDVVHFHTDWAHLPLFSRLGLPFLMHSARTARLFRSDSSALSGQRRASRFDFAGPALPSRPCELDRERAAWLAH